ncbi:aerolysin-like protein [Electrophorus electricus]|uniref:aerolysin-like protein n=1 Tax=Electrophorus electricus TaxID=8005 RepID=UPI0015CFC378|nr:aerolysin-like protein [Electrophorus electricus]
MSYLAPVLMIGGHGGSEFHFDGIGNGATLRKIWVWAGGWQIKGIKVWLTDGQCGEFGQLAGDFKEFTFEDGEHFTSLSLWGNGAGTRLGAIKFKTNRSREFFAHMTDWQLKTEYPIEIGSGICMGVLGGAGSDIDRLGFKFINTIKSTVLKNVNYPTLHSVIPKVAVEEIKSMTYHNNSSEMQEYKIESSKKIIKTSSWSVTNKIEFNFSFEVQAGIPEVAETKTGFGFTVGTESTCGLENSEEKTEQLSFPVKVPPGKTVNVDVTIGRVTVDLPYTGTAQITCFNNNVLEFPISGTYKGVTYTEAKATVNEK